jgi:hypothetical protein
MPNAMMTKLSGDNGQVQTCEALFPNGSAERQTQWEGCYAMDVLVKQNIMDPVMFGAGVLEILRVGHAPAAMLLWIKTE